MLCSHFAHGLYENYGFCSRNGKWKKSRIGGMNVFSTENENVPTKGKETYFRAKFNDELIQSSKSAQALKGRISMTDCPLGGRGICNGYMQTACF